jgi:hypothetical protein
MAGFFILKNKIYHKMQREKVYNLHTQVDQSDVGSYRIRFWIFSRSDIEY